MVESLSVSRHIGRLVINAFNNILAYYLAELGPPEGAGGRLAIAVVRQPAGKVLGHRPDQRDRTGDGSATDRNYRWRDVVCSGSRAPWSPLPALNVPGCAHNLSV